MLANFVDKTIWTGDNLDILRGLNSDSVDLIYLDPPFNSNRDYAHHNRIKGDRPQEYLIAQLRE